MYASAFGSVLPTKPNDGFLEMKGNVFRFPVPPPPPSIAITITSSTCQISLFANFFNKHPPRHGGDPFGVNYKLLYITPRPHPSTTKGFILSRALPHAVSPPHCQSVGLAPHRTSSCPLLALKPRTAVFPHQHLC